MTTQTLSLEERERYSRHLLLPELGFSGQERLKASRVLVIGAGGLGSPAAFYLAAAGVGTIGIVDNDAVDLSNLQRQILHSTKNIGKSKVESASERLAELNPNVQIEQHHTLLSRDNALKILRNYDVIVDGTDNFATRYLVNDACGLLRKPLVYGSVFRFTGQVSVFDAAKGGCYRCLYPAPPPPHLVPNCAEGGVLGGLPGIIGTMQATEALKIVLGIGETLHRRLLLVDALMMQFSTLAYPHNPHCALCGSSPTITELQDYEAFCNPSISLNTPSADEYTAEELRQIIGAITLIDVREAHERLISVIDGSVHIPLGEITSRIEELRSFRKPIVFHCHSGKRSSEALRIAQSAGISAKHLKGGIVAWQPQEK